MDVLGLEILNQLWGGVARMKLDLVDGGDDLCVLLA